MPEWTISKDPAPAATPKPLASWYAQGLSDGLGDRLLMFDNSSAPSLELLRFRPDLGDVPGFEAALREQVRRLDGFRHPSFARVRAVQRLEPDDELALISNCTPGKRLSDVLHRARGAAFAAAVIEQLGPALLRFQQHDTGVTHGVLSPDRIIVSPDGQFTIVEHVVGRAIDVLGFDAGRLRTLGVPVPPRTGDAAARLDVATDWYQLGLVAMSALLGRQVTGTDLPQLERLLDRMSDAPGRDGTVLSPWIREWLDRALKISNSGIDSTSEARAAIDQVLDRQHHGAPRRIQAAREAHPPAAERDIVVEMPPLLAERPAAPVIVPPSEPAPVSAVPPAPMPAEKPAPAAAAPPRYEASTATLTEFGSEADLPATSFRPAAKPEPIAPRPQPVGPTKPSVLAQAPASVPPVDRAVVTPPATKPPAATPSSATPSSAKPSAATPSSAKPSAAKPSAATPSSPTRSSATPPSATLARPAAPAREPRPAAQPRVQPKAPVTTPPVPIVERAGYSTGVVAALMVLVLVQAGVIALMARALWFAAPPPIAVKADASGGNVLVSSKPAQSTPLRLAAAPDLSWITVTSPSVAGLVGAKGPAARTGSIKIASPINLSVLENGRQIGSVPGAELKVAPGKHEIELVNAALGYRLKQSIEVEAGQTVSLHVAPAQGWATIYAVPTAEVSIDGKPVGRTPLGPLPLALGEHTVTFTHPTGATDRQRIKVNSGETIRVIGNPRR